MGSGIFLSRMLGILGAPPKYLGFASNSMESSGLYSLMMYGPVPGYGRFSTKSLLTKSAGLILETTWSGAIGMSGML